MVAHLPILTSTLKPFLWTNRASEVLVYPTFSGNATTLTVVNSFSKAVHFVPLSKLSSAVETGVS